MNLKSYIKSRNITQYKPAEIGDVPKIIYNYETDTGLPKNKDYLECGLPLYVQDSIKNMIKSWEIIDSGEKDYHWDLNWCELNADINSAEVEQEISSEQAWYLREKYLRMKRED